MPDPHLPDDLPRRLSVFDATTIVVGSMIGSGIFLKASGIAQKIPSPTVVLAVWMVSGILTLFGALTLAELGACRPRAGGLYVYLYEAYGPFVAFLFGWSLLAVVETGSIAGIAVGIARTFAAQVPLSDHQQLGVAAVLIVTFTAINLLSVRLGAGVQNLFTVAKSLGILLLILGGFLFAHGSLANVITPGQPHTPLTPTGAFAACMLAALWAYDGWVNLSFMAGEVREPQRSLPRALTVGTLFVTLVYLATNAAYHYVLPVEQVQAAKNVSRELAAAFMGAAGAIAMTVIGMVSSSGTLNSSVMTAPRVYFAMARDGLFFGGVAAVHSRFLTPHVSLILQCVWALGLLARWQTFDALTDNVVFVYWIFYALGAGAVIILRRQADGAERPYSTPGYPWVPLVFIAGALFLIGNTVYNAQQESREALYLLALGALLYPLFRRGHSPRA